jgi:hypothetical protein
VVIGGGNTEFAEFPLVHLKTTGFPWLIHKAKTEEPKTEVQQLQTGLTGLTGVRRRSLETSKLSHPEISTSGCE